MTYVIAEPCIDECPVDCIYEGERMLYINPDECVDCAACEPVCPVDAIYFDQNVPDEYVTYTQHNEEFFADLGSPGGASRLGVLSHDPRDIRELPRSANARS